ncbi:hypothetical protein IV203_013140 [Nitzschia inconspicua]|uniref:Uncharacterized protein n=1 Tax=Nitzschia inconspicua TaxID=303405 RepID=A0A9K3M5D7_9STRA|nr:hypothetical protein IV203_013140 [Nitzschia inconspicua]
MSAIETAEAINSVEFQQGQIQSTTCDFKTENIDDCSNDTAKTPARVNAYSIEDMEEDLQTLSRVSHWSDEMEIMREVQEKIRLLVWDLDRQREELKLELHRHKEIICQLEEQNGLNQVKIDILTSTMREFIKEDPERWKMQEHPLRSSSWFGFPFHSSWNSTSPPSIVPTESTTLSTSIGDPQEGDEIFAQQRERSDEVTVSSGLDSCSTEVDNKDGPDPPEGQQGECLPKHDDETRQVSTTECKGDPGEPEDSTIGTERRSDDIDATLKNDPSWEVLNEAGSDCSLSIWKWSLWNKE